MFYKLTITPLKNGGRELVSTSFVLSQDELDDPYFGEVFRPLILGWAERACEIDESSGEIEGMPVASRPPWGL